MPFQVSNTDYFKAIDFHPFSQENLPYTIGIGVVTVTALAFLARHAYKTYTERNRNIQVIAPPVASQPAEGASPPVEVKPEPQMPRQVVARPMTELQKKIAEHPIGAVLPSLSPKEIVRTVSCVSKAWHAAVSEDLFWEGFHMEVLFPKLRNIEGRVWIDDSDAEADEKHKDIDANTPKKRAVILKLHQIYHALEKNKMWIKGDAGITQLTLQKGLNYKEFKEMMEEGDELDLFTQGVDMRNYDRFTIPQTCTILIANGLLEGEFSKQWHRGGTKEHLKKTAGGEVAQLLPLVVNIALTYLFSPEDARKRLLTREGDDHNWGVVFDQIDPAPHTWDSGKRRVGDFQGKTLSIKPDCADGSEHDQAGRLTVMWKL